MPRLSIFDIIVRDPLNWKLHRSGFLTAPVAVKDVNRIIDVIYINGHQCATYPDQVNWIDGGVVAWRFHP